jgi:hypothetical protein
LLHSLAKLHPSFDDPHLVSHAGLIPVMALAQRAGLADLTAEHVRPGGECQEPRTRRRTGQRQETHAQIRPGNTKAGQHAIRQRSVDRG